jgi:hypothetical protein
MTCGEEFPSLLLLAFLAQLLGIEWLVGGHAESATLDLMHGVFG